MHDGEPCGRPVYAADRNDKCICHSLKEDKDNALFFKEVGKVLQDSTSECLDFTSFVFPSVVFTFHELVQSKVVFSEAKFLSTAVFEQVDFGGDVDFSSTSFSSHVSFRETKFGASVDFTLARFESAVLFDSSTMEKANFWNTAFATHVSFLEARFVKEATFRQARFEGTTLFTRSTFKEKADFSFAAFSGRVDFVATKFQSTALFRGVVCAGRIDIVLCSFASLTSFRSARIESTARVKITGTNEQGQAVAPYGQTVEFSLVDIEPGAILTFFSLPMNQFNFVGTDLSSVRFINVAWPTDGRWYGKRAVVPHEPKGKNVLLSVYNATAQVYRGLQAAYTSSYRYPEAGDFFIGEQIMTRKAKKRWWSKVPSLIYAALSYYGERFLRPALWLVGTLLAFPIYLLYHGDSGYDWSWDPRHFLLLSSDYLDAIFLNFSFVTFGRSEIAQYLSEPHQRAVITLESIWVVILVTFFVLALRRRFKRKSF